jgi:hypothetical protein
VPLETKLLPTNEKKYDYQKIKFPTSLRITTGDLLALYDHVDQILRYSTEFEILNTLHHEAMLKMTKIIGWKFGTTFSWSFTVMKNESYQD